MILKYKIFLERKDLDESVAITNLYNSIVEEVGSSLNTGKGLKLGNNMIVFELKVYGGNLDIVLMPNLKGAGFGLTSQTKKTFIAIPKDSCDIKNITNYEDAIKHEISHLFDYIKSGKELSNTSDKNKIDYYNDVQEINAYYTQGINKVISLMDNDESYRVILNDFKKFKSFFLSKIKCFDDIKSLWNEKSMKRLDKRLYLVQQELKEKYK
jgi:hypothetical protein